MFSYHLLLLRRWSSCTPQEFIFPFRATLVLYPPSTWDRQKPQIPFVFSILHLLLTTNIVFLGRPRLRITLFPFQLPQSVILRRAISSSLRPRLAPSAFLENTVYLVDTNFPPI